MVLEGLNPIPFIGRHVVGYRREKTIFLGGNLCASGPRKKTASRRIRERGSMMEIGKTTFYFGFSANHRIKQ